MKHIKVFAPGTVANLGCGFDVMGLTLDGVGDVLEVGVAENAEGFEIRNRSGVELPGNVEENVITPAVRALLEAYGRPVRIEVEILEKIAPGSGIGSSAASSAAAVYGVNELLGRPFSGKQLVEFAMMGEALLGGTPHADNVGPALLGGVVLAGGALAMNIAGSGPSVFALASNYEAAVRISGEMKRHFEGLGIGCNSYAGRVSNAGARVVE